MDDLKLTPKQRQFVEEYLVDLNGTQAAIRAGYSPESAGAEASRLLTNVNIKHYLAIRKKERMDALGITQERILKELSRIAFFDLRKAVKWNAGGVGLMDSDEIDDDTALAIQEVTETQTKYGSSISIKAHSKMEALKLLARHTGVDITKHDDEAETYSRPDSMEDDGEGEES